MKTPKIYFRDSGVLDSLLGIPDMAAMVVHPKLGLPGRVLPWSKSSAPVALRKKRFFWGVHNQGEIDLLIIRNGVQRGFEIKYTDHSAVTASRDRIPEKSLS